MNIFEAFKEFNKGKTIKNKNDNFTFEGWEVEEDLKTWSEIKEGLKKGKKYRCVLIPSENDVDSDVYYDKKHSEFRIKFNYNKGDYVENRFLFEYLADNNLEVKAIDEKCWLEYKK